MKEKEYKPLEKIDTRSVNLLKKLMNINSLEDAKEVLHSQEFNKTVEEAKWKEIEEEFIVYTAPILSREDINDMIEWFKQRTTPK